MDKTNGIVTGTPEDLALQGHLSHFFARKGIVFDMESGLFRIANHYKHQVQLVGEGYRYSLVRKALQRNAILANPEAVSAIRIETGHSENSDFILHLPPANPIRIKSIENLLEIINAQFQENAEIHPVRCFPNPG